MTQEQFEKLSRQDKRIAIAKDVIAQINSKKFIPKNETYFTVTLKKNVFVDEDDELDKVIKEDAKNCYVCGIGSMFASHVLLADDCTVSDIVPGGNHPITEAVVTSNDIHERLEGIFEPEELDRIEVAFEGYDINGFLRDHYDASGTSYLMDVVYNQEIEGLRMFHKKFRSAKSCLIGIMENIIKNKGEFIPYKLVANV